MTMPRTHLQQTVGDHVPCMHDVGRWPIHLKFVRIGPITCTIDGQVITINTLRNLVGKLFHEANKVTSNQLLLGLQTAWIDRVIVEGNIVDMANKGNVGYSFLSDAVNEFHRHG